MIDYARFAQKNIQSTARGEVDFRDLTDVAVTLLPSAPMMALTLLEPGDCVDGVHLSPAAASGSRRAWIDEVVLRGNFFTPDWTISLKDRRGDDPLDAFLPTGSNRSFPICPGNEAGGKTITLGAAQGLFP